MDRHQVDELLVRHGQELFWPRAKRGRLADDPNLPHGLGGKVTPAAVRQRVRLVVSGAPSVLVRITGTATGMGQVRQHLRYVTERGEVLRDSEGREYVGPEEVRVFGDQFQCAGSPIPAVGTQREAFQLALDMPPGTDPETVQAAAVAFAQQEFAGHRWAWVYHGHQKHPHVHLIVRAQGRRFQRLAPSPADLHRWRETFARELRSRGVPAQATTRLVRGAVRNEEALWVTRARKAGTLRQEPPLHNRVTLGSKAMQRTLTSWAYLHAALSESPDAADHDLAAAIKGFVRHMPMVSHVVGVELDRQRQQDQLRDRQSPVQVPQREQEPDLGW